MKKIRGQGIAHVGSLFEKYTKLLKAPQGVVIQAALAVVEKVCGHTLDPKQCSYNVTTQTLRFVVSGIVKTEISLKKRVILKTLEEILGKENSPKEIQ